MAWAAANSSSRAATTPPCAAAGRKGPRWHDLRHTGAVLAAQTGATLAEMTGRLGHTAPGATMRYQHAAADRDAVFASGSRGSSSRRKDMPVRTGDNVVLPRRLRGQVAAASSGWIPDDVGVAIPETDVLRIRRWCRERVPEHLWSQVKVEADVESRHVTIVEVRPPWDGVGDHTRFPIARLRYTAATGQWSI